MYSVIDDRENGGGIIKCWDKYIPPIEQQALDQMKEVAKLSFVHKHIALMSDAHAGIGCCIGSVIATKQAIIPSTVSVDIGCGVIAVKTSLTSKDLPENLKPLRLEIEKAVPHGRSPGGKRDVGSWENPPNEVLSTWRNQLEPDFKKICEKYPNLEKQNHVKHLGSLGSGNHYISINLDESDNIWLMLHSGSRGIGGAIGRTFIELAKRDMETWHIHLPNKDLAYLPVGTKHFDDYWECLIWAQQYAKLNRKIMLETVLDVFQKHKGIPQFITDKLVIDNHHNYCARENFNGENLFITRKGAIRAREGDLGIIPGVMGGKSFIVRGKGNQESWCSASHGAGRLFSRTKAKQLFTLDDHIRNMKGVECRLDEDVIDETTGCYKDIDQVIKSQEDLVDTVHSLQEILSVKG